MTGAERQWALNRRNFEGCWEGPTRWYGRGADGQLDLRTPELVIPNSCYAISFEGPSTGLWHGRGLRFAPGGERRLPLSSSTYNQGGSCWQFEGAGGQSSLVVPTAASAGRFGHELNVFSGRSRSMLIALWLPHGEGPELQWQLDQLAVTPFRCSLGPLDPPRAEPEDSDTLLAALEGWPGSLERLEPGRWPADPGPAEACAPFTASSFRGQGPTACFHDGLVACLPELLPQGAFRLEVGCRTAQDRFERLSVLFDRRGTLEAWERRRYRCPS